MPQVNLDNRLADTVSFSLSSCNAITTPNGSYLKEYDHYFRSFDYCCESARNDIRIG